MSAGADLWPPRKREGDGGGARSVLSVDLNRESTDPGVLIAHLWGARELVGILARKEFYVRYRRASFGVLWALGLPLLQGLIVAVVFSRVARIPHTPHYAAFVLSGMVAWTYFSSSVSPGSTGIVDAADMSSRVYFPRAVLPIVQVAANVYGLAAAELVLLILCPVLGVALSARALILVPATFLLVLLTLGLTLVTSALHVYFRDIRYAVTAALMIWMYVTPVIYPATDAHGALGSLIDSNPLTAVVGLFHLATVGGHGPDGVALLALLVWSASLLAAGLTLHCRFDRVFADLL